MKNVILALLSLAPTLVSAQTISEFERGYNAGKISCNPAQTPAPTDYWYCTVGSSDSEIGVSAAFGRTQAEGTMALGASTIARYGALGFRVECKHY